MPRLRWNGTLAVLPHTSSCRICHLDCDAVCCGRYVLIFQRQVLCPSSVLKAEVCHITEDGNVHGHHYKNSRFHKSTYWLHLVLRCRMFKHYLCAFCVITSVLSLFYT